jgi:hypothetical protein
MCAKACLDHMIRDDEIGIAPLANEHITPTPVASSRNEGGDIDMVLFAPGGRDNMHDHQQQQQQQQEVSDKEAANRRKIQQPTIRH